MAKMAPMARPTRARAPPLGAAAGTVAAPATEAAAGAEDVTPSGAAAGGTTPAVRARTGSGLAPPAPTTVTVSIMDTVVPTIPDVTANKTERKMPYPTLKKCEDAPTYSTMSTAWEEMFCNAIAVKSTFWGGGEARPLRPLHKPATYLI